MFRFGAHFDHDFPAPGNPGALIFHSSSPDKVEIFSNAIHAGLSYNSLVKDKVHRTRDGTYAEASVEWGPRFFLNSDGQADYYRLNGTVESFKTLYASPPVRLENRLSLYPADGTCAPAWTQPSAGSEMDASERISRF